MNDKQIKWLNIVCQALRTIIKSNLEEFLAAEDWQPLVDEVVRKLEWSPNQNPVPVIDGEMVMSQEDVCPLFVGTIMDFKHPDSLLSSPYRRLLLALKVMREKFIYGMKYYSELDPDIPPEEQLQITYDCQPRYYNDALYYWGGVDFSEEALKERITEALSELLTRAVS